MESNNTYSMLFVLIFALACILIAESFGPQSRKQAATSTVTTSTATTSTATTSREKP